MLLILIWPAVIWAALYLYFKQLYSRFDSKDVKTFKYNMWNNLRIVLKFDHFAEQMTRLYEQFPGERFVGKFDLVNPMLIVLDIELIKKITVKDFEYFIDHRTIIDGKIDPLFGRNLFSLKGDEWKDMRSTLSPAFTSSKIRLMVPFMVEVGKQMIKALKEKCRESQLGYIEVEVKDMTTRYANDVIASCGFGLSVDSHAERGNKFYEQVKEVANMNVKRLLIFMGLVSAPKLMKVLKLSLFSHEARTFFKTLVMSTMEERQKRNIIRPDMIHLLMEAKKGKLTHDENTTKDIDAGFATVEESSIGRKKVNREWSDDDLTAQVILFFMAGFETVSSAMSFLLHELAVNPDVQHKLYREIVEYDVKNGGKFDYTSIQNMTYMDMVVSGDEWKDMRSTLSPAFTSSKIRLMVPFMVEVGKQMIKALKEKCRESQLGYIEVEVKDMTTRYANDVIASCGFGLSVDSHAERGNKFYEQVKEVANMNVKRLLIFMGLVSAPKLMKVLKLSLFSHEARTFFKTLVMSTMEERQKRNIIRPDMIHLLMEAKKGKLTHDENTTKDIDAGFATVEESSIGRKKVNREWSDDDLTAQVILFFMAGFETVSSAMSFLLHELAVNPDVQHKLYREIVEYDVKNGGKFDYTSIQNMTYMDMVVSEVLRLWPPAIALDRTCAKDYNCGKSNVDAKQDFILRKGESLAVPTWAIHRDPKFFPNPNKFDPERFSNENKHTIPPFAYMPFGLGPRNCIGSRFALCEVKIMAYQLLKEMELSPAEKTCIPAKLELGGFNLKLKGGHWVRMTPRQS